MYISFCRLCLEKNETSSQNEILLNQKKKIYKNKPDEQTASVLPSSRFRSGNGGKGNGKRLILYSFAFTVDRSAILFHDTNRAPRALLNCV